MSYSATYQLKSNDSATILALVKCKTAESDGKFYFRRMAKKLSLGCEFRSVMNQVNGLIAARLWESLHSIHYDGGPFDATARDQLLMLACRKDSALAPELEAAAFDRGSRAWLAISRGPKKAVSSVQALCDLSRASFTTATNMGEGFKSLSLEFERAVTWANGLGLTVDNIEEIREVLHYVARAEMVVLVDDIVL